MAALTTDISTPERNGRNFIFPVAARTTIFGGAIVAIGADGLAIPAKTATGLKGVGCAAERAVNLGESGEVTVRVLKGIFLWDNSAGADAIAKKNIGETCYMVDDHTVALTDGSAKRSPAGKIADVDDQGVWVEI